MPITFRGACMADAELLLAWRNDPVTRAMSHTVDEVSATSHARWLEESLANPERQILLAVQDGHPVGTVRADRTSDGWAVSWLVAPVARGRGVAKEMVAAFVRELGGVLRAEVKRDNPASLRVAEVAGFVLDHEANGVMQFVKRP